MIKSPPIHQVNKKREDRPRFGAKPSLYSPKRSRSYFTLAKIMAKV